MKYGGVSRADQVPEGHQNLRLRSCLQVMSPFPQDILALEQICAQLCTNPDPELELRRCDYSTGRELI